MALIGDDEDGRRRDVRRDYRSGNILHHAG